jgi:hypothetical protein
MFMFCSNKAQPLGDVKQRPAGRNFFQQVSYLTMIAKLGSGLGTNLPALHLKSWGLNQPPSKRVAKPIMLTAEFLRRQAENCLRIARTCFDLASAERLRLMAGELNAKATEMDEKERQNRWPHALERNTSS